MKPNGIIVNRSKLYLIVSQIIDNCLSQKYCMCPLDMTKYCVLNKEGTCAEALIKYLTDKEKENV